MQSVFGITPVSEQAREWIDDNISPEPWQWMGRTLVIENRFIAYVVDGMIEGGLEVNKDFNVS